MCRISRAKTRIIALFASQFNFQTQSPIDIVTSSTERKQFMKGGDKNVYLVSNLAIVPIYHHQLLLRITAAAAKLNYNRHDACKHGNGHMTICSSTQLYI